MERDARQSTEAARGLRPAADDTDLPTIPDATLPLMARRALAARRAIGLAIPADLIPDPVLDILTAMFLAHDAGQSMSMDALCEATTVVPAVGRRVVKALQQRGYLSRETDRIMLTPDGLAIFRDAMRNVAEAQARLTREQQEADRTA